MKTETILDAMLASNHRSTIRTKNPIVRSRQFCAFRARILRIDAEKDDEIAVISDYFDNVFAQLEDCRKEIIEKDEEIRVLEKYIKDHDYKAILDYMEKYLDGDIE